MILDRRCNTLRLFGMFIVTSCCLMTANVMRLISAGGGYRTITLGQHYINLSTSTMGNKVRLDMTLSEEKEQTRCQSVDSIKTIKENIFHRIDTTPEKTEKLPFLSNFKNPCWREAFETNSSRIRCLPYFHLIGVTKSGTTDLHHRMAMHPLIAANVPKEVHWLSVRRFLKNRKEANMSAYLKEFDRAVHIIASDKNQENGCHNIIFGDCTPNTIWETSHYWAPNGTLLYTNADVIHRLYPDTKIIVTLRDPVSRVYSNYKYMSKKPSPEEFHHRITKAIGKMQECTKRRSLRHCIDKWPNQFERRTFIGIYHIFLEDFLKVFPRKQILILKMENTLKNVSRSMERIFKFLEVGQPPQNIWSRMISAPAFNANKVHSPDMLNKTRVLLTKFHKQYNEKLKLLLGDEFNYNV